MNPNNNNTHSEDKEAGVTDLQEREEDSSQPGEAGSVLGVVEKELEACEKRADDYLAGWQRAQADYQNLVKETERRIQETIKYATEQFLQELLPVLDHFQYAFKGIPEAERQSTWLTGIEHIYNNLLKILANHGVEKMNTVDELFDSRLHEAVAEVSVEDGKSGTIAEEVEAGFLLHGKVIRHAKVKVIT